MPEDSAPGPARVGKVNYSFLRGRGGEGGRKRERGRENVIGEKKERRRDGREIQRERRRRKERKGREGWRARLSDQREAEMFWSGAVPLRSPLTSPPRESQVSSYKV